MLGLGWGRGGWRGIMAWIRGMRYGGIIGKEEILCKKAIVILSTLIQIQFQYNNINK